MTAPCDILSSTTIGMVTIAYKCGLEDDTMSVLLGYPKLAAYYSAARDLKGDVGNFGPVT